MRRPAIPLVALLGFCQIVTAARNMYDIVEYSIFPQETCNNEDGTSWCDVARFKQPSETDKWVETQVVKQSYVACGNGNMCTGGICGRFLGKDNMCCQSRHPRGYNIIGEIGRPFPSRANLTASDYVQSLREGCERWNSTLSEFDMDGENAKPTTSDCEYAFWTGGADRYPVGDNKKHCCNLEDDAISLFKSEKDDAIFERAVCISAPGRTKAKSGSAAPSTASSEAGSTPTPASTNSAVAQPASTSAASGAPSAEKNATVTGVPPKKNAATALATHSFSLIVLVAAGLIHV